MPKSGKSSAPSRRRREGAALPLTRERIVASALALVDREGLPALSMRRLGKELGVDPMAVYYYLPNKEALLDAIVEAVMAQIDLTVDEPGAAPEERVWRAARAYREALVAHAGALPIILARGPVTLAALRPVEVLLRILRDAGLPPAEAMAGMNAIAAAVRGVAAMTATGDGPHPLAELDALPPQDFPCLKEAMACQGRSLEAGFEFGIRALARGLLGTGPAKP